MFANRQKIGLHKLKKKFLFINIDDHLRAISTFFDLYVGGGTKICSITSCLLETIQFNALFLPKIEIFKEHLKYFALYC